MSVSSKNVLTVEMKPVMKELLIAIYTDYETFLDEEFKGNVEQEDAFSSSPLAGCVKLKFGRLP
jgi:hypothetical protein